MTITKYFPGDTLTLHNGNNVVVRKVITNNMLRVSYGFDTNGNDIVGIIDVTLHLKS